MRVSGGGRLVAAAGSRSSRATEVPDDEKPPLLRAYLEKWKWEVGAFFDGVGPDSTDDELRRIAPDHPAFRSDRADTAVRPTGRSSRRRAARGRRSRRS